MYHRADNYLLQPYLHANFWSVISANDANTIYANTTTIRTSTNNSWVQLGGGITMSMRKIVSVYLYVDDLIGLSKSSILMV